MNKINEKPMSSSMNPSQNIRKDDVKYFINDTSPFYPPLKIQPSPGVFPE